MKALSALLLMIFISAVYLYLRYCWRVLLTRQPGRSRIEWQDSLAARWAEVARHCCNEGGFALGRVNDIVLERRGVTPDTALRLARFFGGDAQSWLNLQQMYDLKLAEREKAAQIEAEIELLALAA